jgi:hypothetical protein
MRPAWTTKGFEKFVIRTFVVKNINGRFMLSDWGRETIYAIGNSKESFIPIRKLNRGGSKEGKVSFDDVAMFPFHRAILLMGVRT